MKKTLLFTAAALMAFSSISAKQVWKSETVFNYGVENGKANPVPGIDGGGPKWWDAGQKTDPSHVCTASNSRFAVGMGGKFYTIDDKQNAIVSFDKNGVVKYADIPSRSAGRWNGIAINVDDAGNIVYDYNFTDATKSITDWGVVKAGTKEQYDITLSTSLETLGLSQGSNNNRVDCIGHIIGDVTKEAYAFVTFNNSGKLGKFTFTGDGNKTTSLTCEIVQDILFLEGMGANSATASACPSVDFEGFKADGVIPQNHRFYCTVGKVGNREDEIVPSFEDGNIAKWGIDKDNPTAEQWQVGLTPMGNRGYAGVATFALQGKRYIVRNYVTEEFMKKFPNPGYGTDPLVNEEYVFSKWKSVMNFGIFDVETGECVASWMGSEYANGAGMGQLSAEVIDDKTVNVYTYAATSTAEPTTGTIDGCYAAMVKFTVEEGGEEGGISGSGTEADPYLIATADDLCNAYKLIPQKGASDMVYFKQTADIDMAGIKKYMALNGWGGAYDGKFTYDGDYHIIKNFSPEDQEEIDNVGGYYCQSVFGVLRGKVMNLGIVDCNLDGANFGVGIVAAYCGTNGVAGSIDNVFATGKMTNGSKYSGGFFGTGALPVSISNSYAIVEVDDSKFAGGMIGRIGQEVTIENSYVKATVTGAGTKGLIAGVNAAINITGKNVIAIGEGDLIAGNAGATTSGVNQVATLDEVTLGRIQKLAPFNEKKMLDGYPTLNWVEIETPEEPGDGTEAHPYLIATAEDLCNAYKKVDENPNGMTYFKQTADIDMAGITEYITINGNKGGYNVDGSWLYTSAINYDGNYHLIKNFAPKYQAPENTNGKATYYCQSVFGVLVGEVKNLGIVDCNIAENAGGTGALAAYAGHGNGVVTKTATVDNVFVIGNVHGTSYAGGFFGTTGNDITITNSYAVVDVEGKFAGGFVGRLRNTASMSNGYVMATVKSVVDGGNAAIVAGTDKTPAVNVNAILPIGSGNAFSTGITINGNAPVMPSMTEQAKTRIQNIAAFNEKKEVKGNPTLNWMTADQIEAAGVEDVIVDNDENAPVEYFNLQGVRIENPAQGGLYIKRQGKTATKVIIR